MDQNTNQSDTGVANPSQGVSNTTLPSEPMPSVEPAATPLVDLPVSEPTPVTVVTPPDPASAMIETSSEEVDNGQNV